MSSRDTVRVAGVTYLASMAPTHPHKHTPWWLPSYDTPAPPPPKHHVRDEVPGSCNPCLYKVYPGDTSRPARGGLSMHRVPLAQSREETCWRGAPSAPQASHPRVTPQWTADDRRCQPDSHLTAADFRRLNYTDGFSGF